MRNEEGERFLEMAQGLDLTIMNTYFKKPEEQKITYRSETRSSQIDFLLVRNEDRKQIRDCKVIPGEAVVAQHRILVMDLANSYPLRPNYTPIIPITISIVLSDI